GEDIAWVNVDLINPDPSEDDWVAVFSPAIFSSSTCSIENEEIQSPYLCSSPIKYKYANYSDSNYTATGRTSLKFQVINQREDFSIALFSGGLSKPKLVAVSNFISFANPKAPLYPRLAHGKSWNEMTVTWTSGYSIDEAVPFAEWGAPALTVGWRDLGFTHTSFLTNLWPNTWYSYRIGHILSNGSYVWSKTYSFKSSPYPGQDSLQRVIIFGDMGKGEHAGSNEYSSKDPGALNSTDQLIKNLKNYDIVFHIGDIAYADGYITDWDQFLQQVEPIASTVPYMVARFV
ncbi:putative inactive purple acid phosphatase 27, partial [Quercus suber]